MGKQYRKSDRRLFQRVTKATILVEFDNGNENGGK